MADILRPMSSFFSLRIPILRKHHLLQAAGFFCLIPSPKCRIRSIKMGVSGIPPNYVKFSHSSISLVRLTPLYPPQKLRRFQFPCQSEGKALMKWLWTLWITGKLLIDCSYFDFSFNHKVFGLWTRYTLFLFKNRMQYFWIFKMLNNKLMTLKGKEKNCKRKQVERQF